MQEGRGNQQPLPDGHPKNSKTDRPARWPLGRAQPGVHFAGFRRPAAAPRSPRAAAAALDERGAQGCRKSRGYSPQAWRGDNCAR